VSVGFTSAGPGLALSTLNIQDMTARTTSCRPASRGCITRGTGQGIRRLKPVRTVAADRPPDEVRRIAELRVRMWSRRAVATGRPHQRHGDRHRLADRYQTTSCLPSNGDSIKLRTGGAVAAAFRARVRSRAITLCHLGAHPVSKVQRVCNALRYRDRSAREYLGLITVDDLRSEPSTTERRPLRS